jgi:FlaA1/EpsC-like NDP-sugar epimerase/lipopolysaccharide/colanic/teichoic acid biosynthesis glycosyltransferase
LAVATIGLVVLLPVMLVVALLVKLDSKGPILYRADRVGRYGREFRLYKFRTMIEGAHKHGPAITARDDPRITRLGRILRTSRIDELPQLVNVIRGDMSLVGPRPEDPTYVAFYTPEQSRLLSVRPGITSPASLAYRNESEILPWSRPFATYLESVLPAKLAIDLAYLERQTFWSDLAVIARTLGIWLESGGRLLRWASSLVRRRLLWMPMDVASVAIGFYIALLLRFLDGFPQDFTAALPELNAAILPLMILYSVVNVSFRVDRRLWRYATVTDAKAILVPCVVSTAIAIGADLSLGRGHFRPLPLSVIVMGAFFSCGSMAAARYWSRLVGRLSNRRLRAKGGSSRAVIYGAGDSGHLLAWRLLTAREGWSPRLIGFIDDDPRKRGLRIHGLPVLGRGDELASIVKRKGVDLILLAMANVAGERLSSILSLAQRTPAQIRMVPNLLESVAKPRVAPLLREVQIVDLLGRGGMRVDREACGLVLNDKTVLVTGGCGSVGSELCRQIANFSPQRLLVLDNNESALYDVELELRARYPTLTLTGLLADVADPGELDFLFSKYRPQVIFHAAAYKHVPLMEQYPEAAVRVNIGGTLTTLRKAAKYGVERFVLVSTDKAVNAESVMGATKRVAELLVLDSQPGGAAAGPELGTDELLRTAVRFGNVLGSRGSVVPTFARQIEAGGPVTVTHPDMTRYFMDLAEAATLIIQAAALTHGHDIFMLEMGEPIRVDDLARHMIRLRGLRPDVDIQVAHVGMRPGEKLHEELTFADEVTVPTSHPLIHQVTGTSASVARSPSHAAQALLRLALTGQRQRLIEQLMLLSRQPTSANAIRVTQRAAARGQVSTTRAPRRRKVVTG